LARVDRLGCERLLAVHAAQTGSFHVARVTDNFGLKDVRESVLYMTQWIPVFVSLIAALPALLAWFSSRKNSKAIQQIHIDLNSRLTQLLESTKGQAIAEGYAAGLKEGKVPL
jgi:hypothetical protein